MGKHNVVHLALYKHSITIKESYLVPVTCFLIICEPSVPRAPSTGICLCSLNSVFQSKLHGDNVPPERWIVVSGHFAVTKAPSKARSQYIVSSYVSLPAVACQCHQNCSVRVTAREACFSDTSPPTQPRLLPFPSLTASSEFFLTSLLLVMIP